MGRFDWLWDAAYDYEAYGTAFANVNDFLDYLYRSGTLAGTEVIVLRNRGDSYKGELWGPECVDEFVEWAIGELDHGSSASRRDFIAGYMAGIGSVNKVAMSDRLNEYFNQAMETAIDVIDDEILSYERVIALSEQDVAEARQYLENAEWMLEERAKAARDNLMKQAENAVRIFTIQIGENIKASGDYELEQEFENSRAELQANLEDALRNHIAIPGVLGY